jgi:hypothetical protein
MSALYARPHVISKLQITGDSRLSGKVGFDHREITTAKKIFAEEELPRIGYRLGTENGLFQRIVRHCSLEPSTSKPLPVLLV